MIENRKNNVVLFICFAIARSAYLRLRPGSDYLRLRWLVEHQHSAAFACGLPLLFSPAVWHVVRQDADSTHENIDNFPGFLYYSKIVKRI